MSKMLIHQEQVQKRLDAVGCISVGDVLASTAVTVRDQNSVKSVKQHLDKVYRYLSQR